MKVLFKSHINAQHRKHLKIIAVFNDYVMKIYISFKTFEIIKCILRLNRFQFFQKEDVVFHSKHVIVTLQKKLQRRALDFSQSQRAKISLELSKYGYSYMPPAKYAASLYFKVYKKTIPSEFIRQDRFLSFINNRKHLFLFDINPSNAFFDKSGVFHVFDADILLLTNEMIKELDNAS